MAPFKKRRVYKRKASTRKPRAKRTGVSLAVKSYVKKQIHVNIENKIANFNPATVPFGNYLESTNLHMRPLLPYPGYNVISQGIGEGARIGNEIKLRKVTLNYVLRPLPYSATSPGNPFPGPSEVEMFLGFLKQAPGILPGTVDIGYLYQGGNVSYAPSGGLVDLIADVNKDYWTIKKRWRHKMGYSQYTGTGSSPAVQYNSNNDFKLNVVKKMDITRLCPKTLKFNDADNLMQGQNLFMFFQSVSAGGSITTSAIQSCNLDYWVSITYEDA